MEAACKDARIKKMVNNHLVSIIIINWNGKKYLESCLSSIYAQDYKSIEVIVVDNASTDNSVQFIRSAFPRTKIIINKKNLGYAEANNIGYQKVTGQFILFLNNDTTVTKTFLVELMKIAAKNHLIGGAQSRILLMDDPTKLDAVGAFLTRTGFLYHYGIAKLDSKKYHKKIPVFSAKGACMLFKKEVLENILVNNEVFDSSYFAYSEETDMCHRVWLAGYQIVYVPESVIYHKMGGTSTRMNNAFIQFHSFKNRINSYIKNFGIFYMLTILPLHLFLCEAYAFSALLKLQGNIFVSLQKAIWWNIANIKVTMRKRKYIQSTIRKKSDKVLESYIMRSVRLSYYFYLLTDLGKYED